MKSGLVVTLCAVVVGIIVCSWMVLQDARTHGALEATTKWARLNAFPASATHINVEIMGSMFTREFTVTFKAPLADINSWLNECPGTSSVTPTKVGPVRTYEIEPGGGAQSARLEVDEQTGTVKINTYWS